MSLPRQQPEVEVEEFLETLPLWKIHGINVVRGMTRVLFPSLCNELLLNSNPGRTCLSINFLQEMQKRRCHRHILLDMRVDCC